MNSYLKRFSNKNRGKGYYKFLRKIKNNLLLFLNKKEIFIHRECFYCNKKRVFILSKNITEKRGAYCIVCSSGLRNNLVLEILGKYLKEDSIVYNTASVGNVYHYLKNKMNSNNFYYSDYYENEKLGAMINGIRNENLENLTFENEKFDIVISEEVFEHITDYKKAFKEIERVLKKGGIHIFTIPLHENNKTIERIKDDKNLQKVVYHGDYLRDGIAVYTDFGYDVKDIIKQETEMETEIIIKDNFYKKEEITFIDDNEYKEYLKNKDKLLQYFKYNNIVLVSKKLE